MAQDLLWFYPRNLEEMWNLCDVILGGLERGPPTACERRSQSRISVVRLMYTDRSEHAPHCILRRTAYAHRSRDTVRCVAQFVFPLVDGF
jgi:hypothetical protein